MFTYTLTPEIAAEIERFEAVAKRFDVLNTLPRTWRGRVRRELEAESIGASVALEGVAVTIDEVRRILAGDEPRNVTDEDVALVRGYREAMEYVLTRADDSSFAWTVDTIRIIHASVMARSWVQRAGLYRERQNWLQDSNGEQVYLSPPTESVPELVGDLVTWLNGPAETEPTLARAALAHVMLAAVHPFKDGNGRTARIVASLTMYRGGHRAPAFTSLEEWWGAHPADYYAAFRCLGTEWNPQADVTPFVAAHVAAQRIQADALSLRHATERLLWSALEDIVINELGMNERAANALWECFFGRPVTNRYYRGIADVPQVTASHDLKQLQTSGLIVGTGAGPSRAYTGSLELARRVVALFDLGVDASGSGELDSEVRGDITRALAAKASC